jgi:hypothetical protein
MRFLLLAALAVALLTGSAEAYRIIGAGVDSCGTWTADRRQGGSSSSALQDEQWILGFLAGVAEGTEEAEDPLNAVDAMAIWAWMDNYCGSHPLDKIADAGQAFVREHPR